jgi:hypothetical protein
MAFNKRSWRGDRFSERIGRESKDADIGDRAVYFRDSAGRTINISPTYGLQVEDSEGTIIHDTPDCIVASDMNYGGHVYFKDAPNFIQSIDLTYTDTELSRTASSAITNTNLTASIPSDLTNIRGVLINVFTYLYLAAAKVGVGTNFKGELRYSNTYNSISSSYNIVSSRIIKSQVAATVITDQVTQTTVIPVTWDAGIPYITTQSKLVSSFMANGNANYKVTIYIYLMGFLV